MIITITRANGFKTSFESNSIAGVYELMLECEDEKKTKERGVVIFVHGFGVHYFEDPEGIIHDQIIDAKNGYNTQEREDY